MSIHAGDDDEPAAVFPRAFASLGSSSGDGGGGTSGTAWKGWLSSSSGRLSCTMAQRLAVSVSQTVYLSCGMREKPKRCKQARVGVSGRVVVVVVVGGASSGYSRRKTTFT